MESNFKRPRRLRINPAIRDLVRETKVTVHDLIFPLFVVPGRDVAEPIQALPGHFRYSPDMLLKEIDTCFRKGISAFLIFGKSDKKDDTAHDARSRDGIVQEAVRMIKDAFPDVFLIGDVCMCGYTTHGHCGVVHNGEVDNDQTLPYLAEIALAQAESGMDMVAPSAMMDGQVQSIRKKLDDSGYSTTGILSYSVKYKSSYYGPFREALDSSPKTGDRSGYQMDPGNIREALREAELDELEGADMLMVKPAFGYLDILKSVKDQSKLPVAAFNVSGEYSMIKAASASGWIDERSAALEMLTCIKRAGADMIITYFARDVAQFL
jgi:porphobilinogen synthase